MTERGSHFDEQSAYEADQLAPEAIPHLPVQPYSAREMDRLRAFSNISKQVHEERAYLRRHDEPRAWGAMNPQTGRLVEPWMRFDGKFLYTWSHVLDNMYSGEFAQDPKMQAAAQEITLSHREQYDGVGKVMTPGELEDLMSR